MEQAAELSAPALSAAAALPPGEAQDRDAWSFACPDWWQRMRAGQSLVPELPLDMHAAKRAVAIHDRLRLPDVPGNPARAEAAGEWFRDIVRAAFGSLDAATQVRRVREIFALVPKKNDKTTGSASIMVTALLENKRPQAELLLVGPTQEVAERAFQQCAGMIKADPEGYLQQRFHIREHLKRIDDRVTGARLKVTTFDMRVMTGALPLIVLLDELHIMAANHYASRVIGQIRGGLAAKPDSLLIIITTQSDVAPAGVFKTELDYARGVRDGRIARGVRTLPILYEFPEALQRDPDKPWADPRLWHLVNPNLGRSITLDALVVLSQKAQESGEAAMREWASQHLNIQIGMALQSDGWAGADLWEAAFEPALVSLDELIARSEVLTAGIDGGGLDDLLGLGVIGREAGTRRWLVWAKAWACEIALERRKAIAPALRDFAGVGELGIVARLGPDIEELADTIQMLDASGKLAKVGADPAGVGAIVDALNERRIGGPNDSAGDEDRVQGVSQGWRLNGAIKTVERKLADGSLVHGGQKIMAWCVGNAKCEPRGNAVIITKQATGAGKIDPLMAVLDAAALMSLNPAAQGRLVSGEVVFA